MIVSIREHDLSQDGRTYLELPQTAQILGVLTEPGGNAGSDRLNLLVLWPDDVGLLTEYEFETVPSGVSRDLPAHRLYIGSDFANRQSRHVFQVGSY